MYRANAVIHPCVYSIKSYLDLCTQIYLYPLSRIYKEIYYNIIKCESSSLPINP